jgi:hypothetical protein
LEAIVKYGRIRSINGIYHVPYDDTDKWQAITEEHYPEEYAEIVACLSDHPDALIPDPEPSPEEKAAARRSEAQAYLDSTDWYVTRLVEREIPIPLDVKRNRANAVTILNELKGA